jgi:uncharacterized protein
MTKKAAGMGGGAYARQSGAAKRSSTAPQALPSRLARKYELLKSLLLDMERVLVAFSGGADSSLLLKTAANVLGREALAVIASSETYPQKEIKEAAHLAGLLGVRYKVIHTRELDNPDFAANAPDRCYHCKIELFSKLREIAASEGICAVLDGQNEDDRSDFRPGSKAARELGVRSPLQEVHLTKPEVRELSRLLGLPTWDKPSLACLASRFPYHMAIERRSLEQVGLAEEFLLSQGLRQVRVRHHGPVARLELEQADFARIMHKDMRRKIIRRLKELGYLYIALDLEGYRSGSLNEGLKLRPPKR